MSLLRPTRYRLYRQWLVRIRWLFDAVREALTAIVLILTSAAGIATIGYGLLMGHATGARWAFGGLAVAVAAVVLLRLQWVTAHTTARRRSTTSVRR